MLKKQILIDFTDKLKYIKEGIYPLDTPAPVGQIVKSQAEEIGALPLIGASELFTHCIYIDKDNKLDIITWQVFEGNNMCDIIQMTGFVECLSSALPASFPEILLLLDLYCNSNYEEDPKKKVLEYWFRVCPELMCPKGEIIETLLKDSRGNLIWCYQMELILRLFCRSITEAIEFRKGLNAKKTEYWDTLTSMEIAPGIGLDRIISERLPECGLTVHPDMQGAAKLYELFTCQDSVRSILSK